MLDHYLYILIICHKSCNMFTVLNELRKKLQTFVTNNVCLDKWLKPQQQQNKPSNIKPLPEIEPGTSRKQSGYVTSAPPSQLRVSIVVKLFNRFDAIGRNVNKQSQMCGPKGHLTLF